VIIEVQCLPQPLGTPTDRHAHVDAAIAVIQASGLSYEVGALGTTVEGSPDELWPLVRAVHEATLHAGADAEITVFKVAEAAVGAEQPTVAGLTDKFRDGAG
jgi:uncharacterized protein YqgV (UPF0045/DUF77 family)